MYDMEPFRTVTLNNGLQLALHDLSNRYFGDYHRIRIEIRCAIPLRAEFFGGNEDDPQLHKARRQFGESVLFERALERMGVASAEVESVRDELVESFLASSAAYLDHPEFVSRYVQRRLEARGGSGVSLPQ